MKTIGWSCLVILLLSHSALAQRSTPPAGSDKKIVFISGEVSDDATVLVNDEINKWNVENAATLKGHEGEYVTVKCRVEPDAHTIHVLSVSPRQVAKSNPGDSAFRR
jgi:hypothetical protein